MVWYHFWKKISYTGAQGEKSENTDDTIVALSWQWHCNQVFHVLCSSYSRICGKQFALFLSSEEKILRRKAPKSDFVFENHRIKYFPQLQAFGGGVT